MSTTDTLTSGLSSDLVDRAVIRGRQLRSQAVREAFTALTRWAVSTTRAAAGRRATTQLGCSDCGDMMRA